MSSGLSPADARLPEEEEEASQSPRGRSQSIDSIPSTDESVIYEYCPRDSPSSRAPKGQAVLAAAPAVPAQQWCAAPAGFASAGFPVFQTVEQAQARTPQTQAGSDDTAPTIDELRQLQRRLSEVTGKWPDKRAGGCLRNVASCSSVSTMISDGAEDFTRSTSSLRHVISSGSVSSMVSWGTEGGEEQQLLRQHLDDVQEDSPHDAGAYHRSRCPSLPEDFSHKRVPKTVNLAEAYSEAGREGPPTTMMIRNIPNRYTQRELIRELEELGFGGSFDFLYVPIDKATMCNVGYAFVNFIEPAWAARCMQTFDNYPFKKYRKARGKIATVSVAHIQGLEANLRHYENAAVNGITRSRKCGPVVMASIANSISGC